MWAAGIYKCSGLSEHPDWGSTGKSQYLHRQNLTRWFIFTRAIQAVLFHWFNSELPSCNELTFQLLPNPTHCITPKSAQLPEDLWEVLRSLQHFTCTPGLTGTGYIIFGAKQTGWVYTGVGCWCPTMEGLGWAWGRGEVGVVEGFGYKQRWAIWIWQG